MTQTKQAFLTGAALSLILPAVAGAQDIVADDSATMGDSAVMTDSMAASPDATTMQTEVTNVEVTSATEPMDLSTWNYDDVYANGISIEQMIGADVYGTEGEDIGDVENVLFDMDGRILSVVAEVGGFLEIGDTHVNIPWDMVSAEDWSDGITIPFAEDEVETYTAEASYYGTDAEFYGADEGMFGNGAMAENEAIEAERTVDAGQIAEVGGDGAGTVETGPNVWRAGDLLNNTARLREGEDYANYGMVNDIIVRDGQIAAVLVASDAAYGGTGGLYGYPYAGTAGWTRGEGATGTYDMPYDRAQAEMVQPFDPAMLQD